MKKVFLLAILISSLILARPLFADSPYADKHWKASVNALLDLPTYGNGTGDVRLVRATGAVYWYDGANWQLVAGPVGLDHSALINLDYASAGHTGFEPTVTKGNLTEAVSGILTIGGGVGAVIGAGTTIQVQQAGVGTDGYLSGVDWSTFNGKENVLTFSSPGLARVVNTISSTLSTGLSGGQHIYGGTDSGDYLYLHSTTHVTKGYVVSMDDFVANASLLIKEPGAGTNYLIFSTVAMAADNEYSWPGAFPGSDAFLKSTNAGVMSWDTNVYLTAEVDGVIGNEITNVSGTTLTRSGAGIGGDPYLVSLNVGNANSWTAQQDFQAVLAAVFGQDVAGGTPNVAGSIRLWSAGDNAWSTTITAGTQTQDISYVLPPDDGGANQFLQTNGSGTLVWATALTAEADTLDLVTGRGATTTNAITVGNFQTGAAGADGKISVFSEQGATDYTVTLNPNNAMTSNADFYLPADEPVVSSLFEVSTGGVMSYRSISYGGMYIYENAAATAIETADIYHLVRGFSTGTVRNWTYDAGSTGAITAFADAGGGQVQVTSALHGLQNGEIVTISGTTNYNGVFAVANIAPNTFEITDTWVANDATGNFYQGSSLRAGTGAAGIYRAEFSASYTAAGNNKQFKLEIFQNATECNNIVSEATKTVGADTEGVGSSGILTIAEGDYITLAIMNKTDATNATVIHANINLHRID